jgi:glycosyltransferase involved in cell wall biosynthesis
VPLYKKLSKSTTFSVTGEYGPSVSILLVVKNEWRHLKHTIPLLLSQEYPGLYDVWILDDHSTDGLGEGIPDLLARYPSLRYIAPSTNRKGKKAYLLYLSELPLHDMILFTDGDCRPASPQWLASMTQPAKEQLSIVLGYSPYTEHHSYLNRLIQIETQYTGCLYLAAAACGRPYMAVGRNVLYPKAWFLSSKSLNKFRELPYGDDDLTLNEFAGQFSVTIQLAPESFVWSVPKQDWESWYRQKSRHVGTARLYKMSDRIRLSLFYGTKIIGWLLAPFILLGSWLGFGLGICFFVSYYYVFRQLMARVFRYRWSIFHWFIAEIQYMIGLIALIPFAFYKKVAKW